MFVVKRVSLLDSKTFSCYYDNCLSWPSENKLTSGSSASIPSSSRGSSLLSIKQEDSNATGIATSGVQLKVDSPLERDGGIDNQSPLAFSTSSSSSSCSTSPLNGTQQQQQVGSASEGISSLIHSF